MKISLKLKVCYVPVVVLFTVASSFVLDSSFGINAKSNVLQMTKSNEAWKENDRIYKLPGVSRMPKYAMYSGYLDSNNTNHVFYWLVECNDPTSKNLIIWFNGGPGCSSLDGFFYENGPLMFDKYTGRLNKNKYSWNKLGNIVYLESPIGAGFSYSDDADYLHSLNDDNTAELNYKTIQNLLLKYPKFKGMNLYITGESYAGVYIPTLASYIQNEGGEIKDMLKGLFIGNGLLHKEINEKSLVPYTFSHGFIGPSLYNDINNYCCYVGKDGKQHCNYHNSNCQSSIRKYRHELFSNGLNIYNFAEDCTYNLDEDESEKYGRFAGWRTNGDSSLLSEERLGFTPVCSNVTFITDYLNRADVRKAIHVRDTEKKWKVCNSDIFFNYVQNYDDLGDVIKSLLENMKSLKILLYYGDFDLACNFFGGEKFVDQLGYRLTVTRQEWMVKISGNVQLAGYYKEYGNLIYATVKAAGHMVPTDKPKEIFQLLNRIMKNKPIRK